MLSLPTLLYLAGQHSRLDWTYWIRGGPSRQLQNRPAKTEAWTNWEGWLLELKRWHQCDRSDSVLREKLYQHYIDSNDARGMLHSSIYVDMLSLRWCQHISKQKSVRPFLFMCRSEFTVVSTGKTVRDGERWPELDGECSLRRLLHRFIKTNIEPSGFSILNTPGSGSYVWCLWSRNQNMERHCSWAYGTGRFLLIVVVQSPNQMAFPSLQTLTI